MESILATCIGPRFQRSIRNEKGETTGLLKFLKNKPTEIVSRDELTSICDDIGLALVICDQHGKPNWKETERFCAEAAALKISQAEGTELAVSLAIDLTLAQQRAIHANLEDDDELVDDDGFVETEVFGDPTDAEDADEEEEEADDGELNPEIEAAYAAMDLAELPDVGNVVKFLKDSGLNVIGDIIAMYDEGKELKDLAGIGPAMQAKILDAMRDLHVSLYVESTDEETEEPETESVA